MSRFIFKNRVRDNFGMVPRGLFLADLPFVAKGVAAYLCCYRGDVAPTPAEVERDLGIGRDARRKAYAALEVMRFITWEVVRKPNGSFVRRAMVVDPLVFADLPAPGDHEAVERLAPENQARGDQAENLPENSRAPENPSGGFAVPGEVDNRLSSDGKSGAQERERERERKKQRAHLARSRVGSSEARERLDAEQQRWAAVAVSLSPFQRSALASGNSLLVEGVQFLSGSREHEALSRALRSLTA